MVELKSEREARLCSTEDKKYVGMIWEQNVEESLGDWKTPWRIWSGGRSHVRYPEFSRLKSEWERTREQLANKYENRQTLTEDEWRIYKKIKYARF